MFPAAVPACVSSCACRSSCSLSACGGQQGKRRTAWGWQHSLVLGLALHVSSIAVPTHLQLCDSGLCLLERPAAGGSFLGRAFGGCRLDQVKARLQTRGSAFMQPVMLTASPNDLRAWHQHDARRTCSSAFCCSSSWHLRSRALTSACSSSIRTFSCATSTFCSGDGCAWWLWLWLRLWLALSSLGLWVLYSAEVSTAAAAATGSGLSDVRGGGSRLRLAGAEALGSMGRDRCGGRRELVRWLVWGRETR